MVMPLTALTGLVAVVILLPFFRRDEYRRRAGGLLKVDRPLWPAPQETLFLIGTGAGVAQVLNILISMLAPFLPQSDYSSSMEQISRGKSLFMMILCLGILAPMAEEVVFRLMLYYRLRDRFAIWPAALISGIVFGIYHGDVLQGVYAAILGVVMAFVLEYSGSLTSSMFLHAGANTWILLLGELLTEETPLWEAKAFTWLALFWLLCCSALPFWYRSRSDFGAGD